MQIDRKNNKNWRNAGLRNLFMVAALGVSFVSGQDAVAAQDNEPDKNPDDRIVQECTSSQLIGTGKASWYGQRFHGRQTANGEIFNMNAMTAAHKTLKMGTMVEVENAETGKKLVVRINDRGPFIEGREIDLSRQAAIELGIKEQGVASVVMRRCL